MAHSLRRRAGVIVIHEHKILLVRLTDPANHKSYLFPPGGSIELGESPEEAAIRETKEETGYAVEITGPAKIHRYDFRWAGVLHSCETHFFPAALIEEVGPAEEAVIWQPLSQLSQAITYDGKLRDILFGLIGTLPPLLPK